MTKKEILGGIYATMEKGEVATKEQLEFIQHQMDLCDGVQTVVVTDANAELKAEISKVLAGVSLTATEVKNGIATNVSVQKVVAVLKAMIKDGTVVRTQEGSKVSFASTIAIEVAEDVAEDEVIADEVQEVAEDIVE